MSTKLYDGIIITVPKDKDVWDISEIIRENCENVFTKLNRNLTIDYIHQSYVDYVAEYFREENKTNAKIKNGILLNALDRWKSEKEEFFKNKLLCKVQLFKPLDNGKIVGYVINNNEPEYKNSLLNLPFVEDFSYWNNSDKESNISEDEWTYRKETWDKIFDKTFLISGTGISIELPETKTRTFEFPFIDKDEFMKEFNNLNSSEKSENKIATRILFEMASKDLKSDNDQGFSMIAEMIHQSGMKVHQSKISPVTEIPELNSSMLTEETPLLPKFDETVFEKILKEMKV